LVATDGCLSRNGRVVNITSADKHYLTRLRDAMQLSCVVSAKPSGSGATAYQLQIGSKDLHGQLVDIGLTPRKSLTIGPLKVPERGFTDFFRGVIDGDGNIRRWIHPTNGREQWTVRVYGGSKPFLSWLQEELERLWSVQGGLHEEDSDGRHHTKYTLKYGKLAAKVILRRCYYKGALALERKKRLAERCMATAVGWSKSKTVANRSEWEHWEYTRINRAQ